MRYRVLARHYLYQGFLKLESLRLSIDKFNGGALEIEREVLCRGDAVAVLIHDEPRDKFLLVEQFRPGVIAKRDPWLIELVAGMTMADERPMDVAIREAKEEANVEIYDLKLLSEYFSSPGGSDEHMRIYYAKADLSEAGGVWGLDSESEDIRVHLLSKAQLIEALDHGQLDNAATQIGVLAYLRSIDRA